MTAIKERPILFSAPMVRAILDGRKTVTRRACKPQPSANAHTTSAEGRPMGAWWETGKHLNRCPFGQIGERLWVRETTEADQDRGDTVALSRYAADRAPVLYSGSDDPEYNGSIAHWDYPRRSRPSIHMPRWACRILLEITDVRVERLQDISEDQARAEGIEYNETLDPADNREWRVYDIEHTGTNDPISSFESLWSSINGPHAWNANPWVWVVEFKRVQP